MQHEYVGVLSEQDPLHELLTTHVWDMLFGEGRGALTFDVFSLDSCSTVYRYRERQGGRSVVGKFFGNKWIYGRQGGDRLALTALMRVEEENMRRIRALGLCDGQYYVVAPLIAAESINCVLVQEFAEGEDLLFYIRQATDSSGSGMLRARLCDLAGFLSALHGRSAIRSPTDAEQGVGYARRVLKQLAEWEIAPFPQVCRLERLVERWGASQLLETGCRVLIHGDVTPTNFKFCDGTRTGAFDVERARDSDPAIDLGCLAAELRHLMFLFSGNRWAGEPFIQAFYAHYGACLNMEPSIWLALMERCRFFMGAFELRIARNAGLDLEYRRRLVEEAEACWQIK